MVVNLEKSFSMHYTSTSLMKNCSMVKKILIILSEKRFIIFFFFSKLISVNLRKKKPF